MERKKISQKRVLKKCRVVEMEETSFFLGGGRT